MSVRRNFWELALIVSCALGVTACQQGTPPAVDSTAVVPMEEIAQRYVKLVLGVGEHEAGYVDSYYGPEEWQAAVEADSPDLAALRSEATALRAALKDHEATVSLEKKRLAFMDKQLIAIHTRVRMLEGEKFSFDEETRLLYDAVSPSVTEAQLDASLRKLDKLLPGEGSVQERYVTFRKQFIVPTERVSIVFDAAIAGCKAETVKYVHLREGEKFTTEYVTDKPWSAYNWYQGNANSLIQVNTDLPFFVEQAIQIGCHEGYPGHHVLNAIFEQKLVEERGWVEFSVLPLFSPLALLMEGTAVLGIDMAFPGEARTTFEVGTLYPLAGLNTESAKAYVDARSLKRNMRYARIEGARRYLDGYMSREDAIAWNMKYRLVTYDRAEQLVRFTETYRGYVINYVLGEDLAADYVTRHGGAEPTARWEAYETLLSSPMTASMLVD